MFPTQKQRTFLLWGEQKGHNAYTQAYTLAREIDRNMGTDVPFLTERQPTNTVVSKHGVDEPKTEARVLSEELLTNDSLGG